MAKGGVKMRITPNKKYKGMPCCYVGTGCAFEDITQEKFRARLPQGLGETGWATLRILNRFVRDNLPVRKQVYYKRGERIKLRDFLKTNTELAGVCVLGHFIYVKGNDYWSYFNNLDDDVVCIWYIQPSQ